MKKFFMLCTVLLCYAVVYAQDAAPAPSGKTRIAVYITGENQTSRSSEIVGIGLTDILSAHPSFTATERTKDFLNTIQQENIYQHSGMVDNSQIAELGKKSGVRYVCVAEVLYFNYKISVKSGSRYDTMTKNDGNLITARFIDVETAAIVGSNYSTSFGEVTLVTAKKLGQSLIKDFQSRNRDNDAEKEKTAIYLADSRGGEQQGMGRILQELLIDAVSRSATFALTERTNTFMETLDRELGHQYSGEVDDAQLARLGAHVGVKKVVTVKVVSNVINMRVIDVVTGDILLSKSLTVADIYDIRTIGKVARDLAVELDRVFLSGSDPKSKSKVSKNYSGSGAVYGQGIMWGYGFSGGYIWGDIGSGGTFGGGFSAAFPINSNLHFAPELKYNFSISGKDEIVTSGSWGTPETETKMYYCQGLSAPLILQISNTSKSFYGEVGFLPELRFGEDIGTFNPGLILGFGIISGTNVVGAGSGRGWIGRFILGKKSSVTAHRVWYF